MDNFVVHGLMSLLESTRNTERVLIALLAYFQGQADCEANMQESVESELRQIQSTQKKAPADSKPTEANEIQNNGLEVQEIVSPKSLEQEIEEMIIELKINGSVRTRKNGLIEVRTVQFGSIYGRNEEEIRQKCEQKLRELRSHVKKPVSRKKPKSLLLSEFYEKNYFPYKFNDQLAKNTLSGIKYNFSFIVKSGFDKPMKEYSAQEISAFLYSIPQTRKRQLIQGLLNNMFDYAVSLGILTCNPAEKIETTKHIKNEGTAFSFDEQEAFFSHLFNDEKISHVRKCYLLFVYLTGTRRNEALTLTVSDVDSVKKILHINGTKTDGSDRFIPLFPLVEKLLNTLTPKNGRYFPFSEHIAESTFSIYGKPHKLHDLRHTFGTIQVCVNKLDSKTVSLYMGHSTVQTTLSIYTHPEQLDRETFLNGGMSEQKKAEILREKYNKILEMIGSFLV